MDDQTFSLLCILSLRPQFTSKHDLEFVWQYIMKKKFEKNIPLINIMILFLGIFGTVTVIHLGHERLKVSVFFLRHNYIQKHPGQKLTRKGSIGPNSIPGQR